MAIAGVRSGSVGPPPTDPLWLEFADAELVILLPTDGEQVRFDGPTLVGDALAFTVRHTDAGPRIAAYGDFLPEPGWPPQFAPEHAA